MACTPPRDISRAAHVRATGAGVALCVALAAASPSWAGARGSMAPSGKEQRTDGAATQVYACVDPSDALAHRRMQEEPCRLPMYHWPRTGAPRQDESPHRQTTPRRSSETEAGHSMFWRFPVQPLGPHEVPRHGR
jgi:hypothetical protein